MKTNLLRLNSVVPHGVGGPEAAALDLIYSLLLHEFEQDVYNYIGINQIGEELNEFVSIERRNVHVNIRFATNIEFDSMDSNDQNLIRLEIIHKALLRIAESDKKFDVDVLGEIKGEILRKNFLFDFVCRTYSNKRNKQLVAKLIVQPLNTEFKYYVVIEKEGREICKLNIYRGLPNVIYFIDLFSLSKWRNENEFVVIGKTKEMEILILIDKCEAVFTNLTAYDNPPYFQMMRADISPEDNEKAHKDWLHSLPPSSSGFITQNLN